MTLPSRKKPPTTAPAIPVDADHRDKLRPSMPAHTCIGWLCGLFVALALVTTVDADKPAGNHEKAAPRRLSQSPVAPLPHDQPDQRERRPAGWTPPKNLPDSLDTLKWVKPKQARMAEIHRPRPSFLRASVKAAPIKVTVPSLAQTDGLVRLASAQAPPQTEDDKAAEVFDDGLLDLDDLLEDDTKTEQFQLPDELEEGDLPADSTGLDDLDRLDQQLDDPTETLTDPQPAMDEQLPNLDNDGPTGDLPIPDNGTPYPDVEPTPLGQPGAPIELEPLSDEIASMFNNRNCPAEEQQFLEAWDEMRRRPISSISLDITPSISPTEPENAEVTRAKNMAAAPSRVWRDRRGRILAEGRMVNYRNAEVQVQTASGMEDLSWYALSNEDLCFVSSWWELPSEFSAATNEYVPRNWTLTTFTWTASALSHKPLYFEEVQLERYGHSAGPLKQPILSGVHFFGNIFFLPYKMGLTPPTECQYALGYYRPGSCAPWLLPAVPLSARGARWQLATVVGALAIFP